MRAVSAVFLVLFLLIVPAHLAAAGGQLKITIKNGGLSAPIELQDAELMKRFFYGSGPGNFRVNPDGSREPTFQPQSFIVDWSTGAVAGPSRDLKIYDIEFLSTRTTDKNTYRVSYEYDAAKKAGFVFIPGQGDPRYAENTWLLLRGVEGNWFRAWTEWDQFIMPLLAKERQRQ